MTQQYVDRILADEYELNGPNKGSALGYAEQHDAERRCANCERWFDPEYLKNLGTGEMCQQCRVCECGKPATKIDGDMAICCEDCAAKWVAVELEHQAKQYFQEINS